MGHIKFLIGSALIASAQRKHLVILGQEAALRQLATLTAVLAGKPGLANKFFFEILVPILVGARHSQGYDI